MIHDVHESVALKRQVIDNPPLTQKKKKTPEVLIQDLLKVLPIQITGM